MEANDSYIDDDIILPPLSPNCSVIESHFEQDTGSSKSSDFQPVSIAGQCGPQKSSKIVTKRKRKIAITADQDQKMALKAQKLVEKSEKVAKNQHLKSLRPKEALKFIQIRFDQRLMNNINDRHGTLLAKIAQHLNFPEIQILKDEETVFENLICWTRKNANDPNKLAIETHYCVVITENEAEIFGADDDWLTFLQRRQCLLPDHSRLTLVVFDSNPKKFVFKNVDPFKISPLAHCQCHFERSLDDLAKFVAGFTKSLSERPFKLQQREMQDFLTFASISDEFKSDLTAKGNAEAEKLFILQKVIRASVNSKPNAEKAAKVISKEYRNIRRLLAACQNTNELDRMRNLVVDPLTGVRVGPAIVSSLCRVLTDTDPSKLVDIK